MPNFHRTFSDKNIETMFVGESVCIILFFGLGSGDTVFVKKDNEKPEFWKEIHSHMTKLQQTRSQQNK